MRPGLLIREFGKRPWPVLILLSAIGLGLSGVMAQSATIPGFCGMLGVSAFGALPPFELLKVVLAINPPSTFLSSWALMLLAMMPPLMAFPLAHVAKSTFPRRRAAAYACFLSGYGAVWFAAGAPLMAVALLAQAYFSDSLAGLIALSLGALAWSSSPWQQMAVNRGHSVTRIAVFGWRGHFDAFCFGIVHAKWCLATCWLWMLLPMVTDTSWHLPLMAVSAAAMLAERIAPLGAPRWKVPPVIALLGGMLSSLWRERILRHA
jgi:Predicted metal-binding integral membrane protein (DUF2182)